MTRDKDSGTKPSAGYLCDLGKFQNVSTDQLQFVTQTTPVDSIHKDHGLQWQEPLELRGMVAHGNSALGGLVFKPGQ